MRFEKGEVVWAKIKGFPWWPGVVGKKPEERDVNGTTITEITVNFIGDNSHAKLTSDKVAKYRENFDTYFKPGHKKLMHSIKLAEEILGGKVSLEEQRDRLKDKDGAASRKKNSKVQSSQVDNDEKEWNSDSSADESEGAKKSDPVAALKQKKKRGRKAAVKSSTQKTSNSPKESKQSSFRRKKSTPQPKSISQTYELKPRRNLQTHTIMALESPYDPNAPSNKDNSVSDTESLKNMGVIPVDGFNMMSIEGIENVPLINVAKPVTNDIPDNRGTINDKFEEQEVNYSDIFMQKSSKLKKSIKNLEAQLAEYTSSSTTAGSAISAIIQECLNELSVESLSSEELLSYLNYDMGKLLFTLSSVLYEFEKFALENGITVHPMIKQKREKVNNLLSTLKIRLISNFLEHQEYVKSHTEDLRERLRERKEQEKKKDERLKDLNASLEKTLSNLEIRTIKVEYNDEEYALNNAAAEKTSAVNEPPIKNFDQFKFDGNKQKSNQISDNVKSREKMLASTPDEREPNSLKAVKSQEAISKHVSNPELRKKVCQKLAKYIEEIYDLKKDVAREKTMIIENKIRLSSPEMKDEYKSRCITLMQLMKCKLITLDEVTDKSNIDWTLLKVKLDKFNSQQKDKTTSGALDKFSEEFLPNTEKSNPPPKRATRSTRHAGGDLD